MRAYRVIGWDSQTHEEWNLGIYLVSPRSDAREERDDAIKQARQKHPEASTLVLDAAQVNSTYRARRRESKIKAICPC